MIFGTYIITRLSSGYKEERHSTSQNIHAIRNEELCESNNPKFPSGSLLCIADNYFEIFPKIPFANNTETLIFAFVVIHGILTKIIYEKEIHI